MEEHILFVYMNNSYILIPCLNKAMIDNDDECSLWLSEEAAARLNGVQPPSLERFPYWKEILKEK